MNDRVLEKLGAENTALLEEFLDKISGKGINEILPILAEFKQRLPEGVEFSAAEREFIIEEALASMPETQRNKYKTMLKMMKIM